MILTSDIKDIVEHIRRKNFLTIMITNQPDVKRKKTSIQNVNEINFFFKNYLKLDDIFVCFDDKDYSYFRKPKPGMLFAARDKWNIDLKKSFFIGDREKDIKAGLKAGVKTVFLDNNYLEKRPIFSHYKISKVKEIKKILC